MRRAALRRCAEWIIARQERDGCWGGIQPPWVYSLMALNLLGYELDHPVMARGLAGLDRFTITEDGPGGPVRRLEACQSPVWDTVLAMIGLADAGLAADEPALTRAARWVLGEEIRGPGDWQVRRPAVAPGGWAFEFDNDNYPDTDDTAEVVLALRRVGPARGNDAKPAIERGLDWLVGMQSRDGGWGAFDADNTRRLVNKLPFCDFGAVIDPPSADVTAHIVEALAAEGMARHPAVIRGVIWLLRAQEPDGSWFGRWGANYVYGTGAAVPALIAAGVRRSKPAIRRAVAWLEEHQNPDGGWGEDLRSYDDPSLAGRGASTASQTAWALLALIAAGEHGSPAAERGVRWLARHPAGRRELGRAAVHRHRLPRRLLHQLSPVPPGLPPERTRPLRGGPHFRRQRMTETIPRPRDREAGAPDATEADPLLVCAPLRIEARAVRRGLDGTHPATVLRSGYGPARAARQAEQLSHGRSARW